MHSGVLAEILQPRTMIIDNACAINFQSMTQIYFGGIIPHAVIEIYVCTIRERSLGQWHIEKRTKIDDKIIFPLIHSRDGI